MEQEVFEVKYQRAKLHRRVLANLVDILIFLLVFVGLFIGCREIVVNTNKYQQNEVTLIEIKEESGIFQRDKDGSLRDIITILNNDDALSGSQKRSKAKQAIETFHNYCKVECSEQNYNYIIETWDEFRLNLESDGKPYFHIVDGEIKETSNFLVTKYYNHVYAKYIDKYCQAYLIKYIPSYYEITKFMSNMLIFFEIAPSYLAAGLITYLLPAFIFRRGKRTFGKALYRIGLVDSRLLNCTYPRFLGRFAIFYFGELVLSLLSFGLPYIVSFSLMVFSKKKQGFPDYMLNLQEIDTSKTKIYNSLDEARIDQITPHKKGIDFTSTIRR